MLKNCPTTLENIGSIMSNYDHEIKVNVEETLKERKVFGEYPARNFFGHVWYTDDKFKCEVYCRHEHIDTIEGDNLTEIMEKASNLYGEE